MPLDKRSEAKRRLWIALFLAPVAILFVLFFLYPLIFTAVSSFTRWRGIGGMQFNGLANYRRLLGDESFLLAVRNNFVWALASGFIQVPLALVVALILTRKPFGWKLLRTAYFLPNVISTVAIAMMWIQIYNPNYGLLNQVLAPFFPQAKGFHWLGNLDTALGAVIAQSVLYIGYFMIIIMAAATNIPAELYEAAEIDGASKLRQQFAITLPLLRGTLVTSVTLAMAYGMRHFESTFLMTGGGPAHVTSTMGIKLFGLMDELQYGRAGAVAMILIVLGTLLIVLLRGILGTKDPMSDVSQ